MSKKKKKFTTTFNNFMKGTMDLGGEMVVTGTDTLDTTVTVKTKEDLEVVQIKDMAGNPMNMKLMTHVQGAGVVCNIPSKGVFRAEGVDKSGVRHIKIISISREGIEVI